MTGDFKAINATWGYYDHDRVILLNKKCSTFL